VAPGQLPGATVLRERRHLIGSNAGRPIQGTSMGRDCYLPVGDPNELFERTATPTVVSL